MVVYGLKPAFRRALSPVLRVASRFHPNTVSAAAVAFAAAAALVLAWSAEVRWFLLVAPVLFVIRLACNALDGMVAERRGLASPRGEMVNEFSDRVNDALIYGGLAFSGLVDPVLALGVLAAAFAVSYLGILPKAAGGPRLYGGPFGKADRMLLLGAGCILAFGLPLTLDVSSGEVLTWTLWVSVPLAAVTVALRWSKAWRALGRPA